MCYERANEYNYRIVFACSRCKKAYHTDTNDSAYKTVV